MSTSDSAPNGHHLVVFVSISGSLPSLVSPILDALQLDRVVPYVYQGVPPPTEDIVSNVYVEARSDFFASSVLLLILASDGPGTVTDDWTLDPADERVGRDLEVRLYAVESSHVEGDRIPESWFDARRIPVSRVNNPEQLPALVARDVVRLWGAPLN